MEYIDRIFYRKINPSDFKKLYDLDKPDGGGGQTYLEAAGIPNDDIVDFLEYAEISDSTLREETRYIYTFNAYVLGNSSEREFITFAPRGGRNYRIIRQNVRQKHPAWRLENGFPEPNRNADGEYTSDGNFEGVIDNLIIMIIRTTYKKYYAGFINSDGMPTEWPVGIGLERIFEGEHRGVIKLTTVKITFIDSLTCPFGEYDVVTPAQGTRVQGGTNIILYGVPGSGKSWTIEHEYCADEDRMERLVFHPDYMYSDFIGQILPVVRDEKVIYEFSPGPFTKLLKKAYENPDKNFYLIVEEINRGNAPAIFGEVFQLLDRIDDEESDYPIGTSEYTITNNNIAQIVYGDEKRKVRLPSNFSIIGTMNTSDQNVFTLDTAFQRRWTIRMVLNTFDEHRFANKPILDTTVSWRAFCSAINDEILRRNNVTSSEDKRLGAYFITATDLIWHEEEDQAEKGSNEWIIARHSNARFPEKVLKYLWDDAFKFVHPEIFETKAYASLELIIETFCNERANDRFKVYNENLRKAILDAAERYPIDNNPQEGTVESVTTNTENESE
ncbi:McrB family protein [Prevotella jejuni]|uniref:McrB family protein n=1 Tax=Prevotella jejuni TaxID=1177574 RepID=UPI003211B67C